jgi:Predicted membrane protein (DUF2142)
VFVIAALAATLAHHPLAVDAANMGSTEREVITDTGKARICQENEAIPAGTTDIRLSVQTETIGSEIGIEVLEGAHKLSSGSKAAGWRGRGVTVPIGRLSHTVSHATVCVTSGPLVEELSIGGSSATKATGAINNGRRVAGRMRIEYLRPGGRSWWSLVADTMRHMGFGHTPPGIWIAWLALALMLAVVTLASWLILAPLSGRRVMLLCVTIAFANGACWSLITPLFQVDDEQDHFAYVQQLAEAHKLPKRTAHLGYSPEEVTALQGLNYSELRFEPEARALATSAEQHQLEAALASNPSRRGSGNAGVATSEPPLYYALQTIPYSLASGGSILLRVELMRLLSALMGALSALFVYLFLREALPGTPWAWSTGALTAALAPLVGYISGSINPDAMLCTVSAACFFLLARGFRRGVTPRLALAIGVITAVGFVTKLNFIGIAPGVICGLTLILYRARRKLPRLQLRWCIAGLGLACSPALVYLLITQVGDSGGVRGFTSSGFSPLPHDSLSAEISYVWQSYLPRLPGMSAYFPGISTWRDVWFNELVGFYGWENTYFPDWVNNLALIPALALAALCLRSLALGLGALRARLPELCIYALIGGGTLVLLGLTSYHAYPHNAMGYRLSRYLLPLLAPAAAGVALAARGAGRRWGPAVGALIVVLVLAQDVFSQLLVIARYYG